MAKRKFEVEISENRKGDGFKESEREATRWGKTLGEEGEKAGDKLAKGVKAGTEKAGAALESAGSTAGDLFSGGFELDGLVDTVGSTFSDMSGKLGPVAGGAGIAIAGAFAVGFMNGMDTEVATDKLVAQLGGSEWAQGMGEVAGDLYVQGFGESVGDTGAAVRAVTQNGLLPEDSTNAQIERLTGRLLTFTDVMEQDMDMSTQAVGTMLRSGIADSGTEALDILTRGIQQGADKAGDLAETFQEYSTVFRDAGISAADATGLMVQGLRGGARDADTVADALKEFAIRAQDGSETSAAGFKAIGLSASGMTNAVAAGGPRARAALDQVLDGLRGMDDPVARNAAAVALFGTKAEDLGDALFGLDLDTAAAGLGKTAGATDKLGSAYDNGKSKIEAFRRQALQKLTDYVGNSVIPRLSQFGSWIGDEVVPVLKDWGTWLDAHVMPALESLGNFLTGTAIPALQSFGHWLGDNKDVMAAVGIGAGVVILGVLVPAFIAWAVSAGAAALATLVAAAPFILLGAAIAAFAFLVIHNWDTIKSVTVTVFRAVTGAISGAFNWVKTNWPLLLAILTGPIGLAVLVITRNWGTIKAGAGAVKDWIVGKFNGLVDFVTGLPHRVGAALSGMWSGLKSGFFSAVNSVISGWNNLSFSIGGGSYDPLGRFGPTVSVPKFTFNTPNIPMLAGGGEVMREGLAYLHAAEVVTPARGGGGASINFNRGAFEGAIISSEAAAERWVVGAIERAGAKGVPITIAGRRL